MAYGTTEVVSVEELLAKAIVARDEALRLAVTYNQQLLEHNVYWSKQARKMKWAFVGLSALFIGLFVVQVGSFFL